jgi:hypothetical protein
VCCEQLMHRSVYDRSLTFSKRRWTFSVACYSSLQFLIVEEEEAPYLAQNCFQINISMLRDEEFHNLYTCIFIYIFT